MSAVLDMFGHSPAKAKAKPLHHVPDAGQMVADQAQQAAEAAHEKRLDLAAEMWDSLLLLYRWSHYARIDKSAREVKEAIAAVELSPELRGRLRDRQGANNRARDLARLRADGVEV